MVPNANRNFMYSSSKYNFNSFAVCALKHKNRHSRYTYMHTRVHRHTQGLAHVQSQNQLEVWLERHTGCLLYYDVFTSCSVPQSQQNQNTIMQPSTSDYYSTPFVTNHVTKLSIQPFLPMFRTAVHVWCVRIQIARIVCSRVCYCFDKSSHSDGNTAVD